MGWKYGSGHIGCNPKAWSPDEINTSSIILPAIKPRGKKHMDHLQEGGKKKSWYDRSNFYPFLYVWHLLKKELPSKQITGEQKKGSSTWRLYHILKLVLVSYKDWVWERSSSVAAYLKLDKVGILLAMLCLSGTCGRSTFSLPRILILPNPSFWTTGNSSQ